jgi:hypothetical protein
VLKKGGYKMDINEFKFIEPIVKKFYRRYAYTFKANACWCDDLINEMYIYIIENKLEDKPKKIINKLIRQELVKRRRDYYRKISKFVNFSDIFEEGTMYPEEELETTYTDNESIINDDEEVTKRDRYLGDTYATIKEEKEKFDYLDAKEIMEELKTYVSERNYKIFYLIATEGITYREAKKVLKTQGVKLSTERIRQIYQGVLKKFQKVVDKDLK